MNARTMIAKTKSLLFLAAVTPLLSGCGGGGAGTLGSLFEGIGGPVSALVSLITGGGGAAAGGSALTTVGGGAEALAQLHNPEPATMLLLGGGMMAMGLMKNLMKK